MAALSTEEAEQYDRQIRLWGLEAQKRLRGSRVLLVGMKGLAAEVAKDIALAGISALTVMDSESLTTEDSGNRFLCLTEGENRALLAVNRLRILNPNVDIEADTSSVEDKTEDFFLNYDLVCVTTCSFKTMVFVNSICRKHNIKFICGDIWGYYGYFFTDLQDHTYAIDVPKQKEAIVDLDIPSNQRMTTNRQSTEDNTLTEKRVMQFCSLQESWGINWYKKPSRYFKRTPPTLFIVKILQSFREEFGRDPCVSSLNDDQRLLKEIKLKVLKNEKLNVDLVTDTFINHCFSDLSPVCAIVGGVLAQEIIKAISAKDTPLHNSFFFDGTNGTGMVESLLP